MTTLLAVPSEAPGGFTAELSPHFGHCQAFSLFRIENDRVVADEVLPFGDHEHGNCLVPVGLLASRGVTAMVAAGMGLRPLNGFLAAGIATFHCGDHRTVGDVVKAFVAGELRAFARENSCSHHHDDDHHSH